MSTNDVKKIECGGVTYFVVKRTPSRSAHLREQMLKQTASVIVRDTNPNQVSLDSVDYTKYVPAKYIYESS